MKILLLAITLATLSFSQIITIIDNGVERKISLPETNSQEDMKSRMVGTRENNSPGIIIAFKKGVKINIKEFETKYNLSLKKKLVIGYYIFLNRSTLPDVKLISNIAKENRDIIKTIRPNWGFNNKAR